MINVIAQYQRELEKDPNLTQTAFCNKFGLDDAFRTSMGEFLKNPQMLERGCGSGKKQATELVQKSETDDWNLGITNRYSKEELFAKVQGQKTLLHTLAKKEFSQRMKNEKTWSSWLSAKITLPCKAIYAKREESDDESDAGIDL